MKKFAKKLGAVALSLAMVGTLIPGIVASAEYDIDRDKWFEKVELSCTDSSGGTFNFGAAMQKVADYYLQDVTAGNSPDIVMAASNSYFYLKDGVLAQKDSSVFPANCTIVSNTDVLPASLLSDDEDFGSVTNANYIPQTLTGTQIRNIYDGSWAVTGSYDEGIIRLTYYHYLKVDTKDWDLNTVDEKYFIEVNGYADYVPATIGYSNKRSSSTTPFVFQDSAGANRTLYMAEAGREFGYYIPRVVLSEPVTLYKTRAKTQTVNFTSYYFDAESAEPQYEIKWIQKVGGVITEIEEPEGINATLNTTDKTVTIEYDGSDLPAGINFYVAGKGTLFGRDYYTKPVTQKNIASKGNSNDLVVTDIPKYTVTFNAKGGSSVASVQVVDGEKLTEPTPPTKANYDFGAWYTDNSCTKKYDFDTPVTKAFTLYAKWIGQFIDETPSGENALGATIGMTKDEIKEAVLTESDKTKNEAGTAVKVAMTISDISGTIESTDKEAAEAAVSEGSTKPYFLGMTFSKTVGAEAATDVTDSIGSVNVTVTIPSEHIYSGDPEKHRVYKVIGVKNGETEELTSSFDTESNKLTFGTDGYSQFMIAYSDEWIVERHNVTFNTNGGTEIEDTLVKDGDALEKPIDPLKPNCEFVAWYTNEALTQEYDFNTPVTADLDLYAKWVGVFSDATDDGENFLGAKIDMTKEALKAAALTDEDLAELEAGVPISVVMELTDISTTIEEANKTAVLAELSDDGEAMYYVGLNITKTIGDASPKGITSFADPLMITLTIPEEKINTDPNFERAYKVVGVKEGVAEVIDSTFDASAKTLTFAGNGYKEYMIAYEDTFVGDYPSVHIEGAGFPEFTEGEAASIAVHFAANDFDNNEAVSEWNVVWVKRDSATGEFVRVDEPSYVTTNIEGEINTLTITYDGSEVTDYDLYYYIEGKGTFYGEEFVSIPTEEDFYQWMTPAQKFTVTFESNGGSEVEAITCKKGFKFAEPEAPTKADCEFICWCLDEELESPYDFNTVLIGNITLYAKWTGAISDVTNPDANDFAGKINMPLSELKGILVTEEEMEAVVEEGKSLNIWLETQDIEASIDADVKDKALAKLGKDDKTALFIDVTLLKQLEGEAAQTISELSAPIKFTIDLPEEYINKDENVTRTFKVIRVHEGVATELPCVFANGRLIVESDLFSTYVVAYNDTVINTDDPSGDDPSGDNGSTITEPTAKDKAPVTGDAGFMGIIVLMIALAAAAVVVYRKREI